jgi:hypothetical protein
MPDNASSHKPSYRYPAELRERAVRMLFETIEQTGELTGAVARDRLRRRRAPATCGWPAWKPGVPTAERIVEMREKSPTESARPDETQRAERVLT